MWSFVLVCSLFAATSLAHIPDWVPNELHEWIKGMHDKCVKENSITDADVESYVISNNSPSMMCYMKCMMVDSRWMSTDFKIQLETIRSMAQGPMKERFLAGINKCTDTPAGNNECEKAYNFNVCLQQADPEHYFLP